MDGDGSTHTEDNWIGEWCWQWPRMEMEARKRGLSGLGIFRVDDGWIGDFSLNFLGYMRGHVGGRCER
jgi:hypothetical protein